MGARNDRFETGEFEVTRGVADVEVRAEACLVSWTATRGPFSRRAASSGLATMGCSPTNLTLELKHMSPSSFRHLQPRSPEFCPIHLQRRRLSYLPNRFEGSLSAIFFPRPLLDEKHSENILPALIDSLASGFPSSRA